MNWKALQRALPEKWLPHYKDGGPEFDEYGCGNWGCAYRTDDARVVFKITTDPTEVDFIATASELPACEGIVKYYALMLLDGVTRSPSDRFASDRKVYALVREAADYIGEFKPDERERTAKSASRWRSIAAMRVFKEAAESIRGKLRLENDGGRRLLARATSAQKFLGRLDSKIQYAGDRIDWNNLRDLGRRPNDLAVFVLINEPENDPVRYILRMHSAAEDAADLVAMEPDTKELGEAMRQYLDWGLMMADLHFKNVGIVKRKGREFWAITDPGHVIRLRSDLPQPEILHVSEFDGRPSR